MTRRARQWAHDLQQGFSRWWSCSEQILHPMSPLAEALWTKPNRRGRDAKLVSSPRNQLDGFDGARTPRGALAEVPG
jgi:hypothetical protein